MMWTSLSILLVVLAVEFDTGVANVADQFPDDAEPECADAPPMYCSASLAFHHHSAPCVPNVDTWCPDIHDNPFRTFDGTCNHANNLGAASKDQIRFLPNAYDDGRDHPRTLGKDYLPLRSARTISLTAHPDEDMFNDFSPMVFQWGQWLDHDITFTPIASEEIPGLTCCREEGDDEPLDEHCFTIEVEDGDPTLTSNCMEFVRSISHNEGTKEDPREQMNLVTAFVDGSQIYGSSEELAEELRDEETRYLLRTLDGGFLPEAEEADCLIEDDDDYCLLAGDVRVNEQPGLSGIHTLWVREHNRIARELATDTTLSDEEVFQRTRKIVGALQQVITYNEWLPIIMGSAADSFQLTSREGRSEYIAGVNPSIINEFSTGAMRFGHSLITRTFRLNGEDRNLRELFNRPGIMVDFFDDVFRSLLGRPGDAADSVQNMDRFFVEEVTQFLFDNLTVPGLALDLVALNVQRGRDHGVQPYTKYRNLCGLHPIKGFHDEALGDNGAALSLVYESVHDIDLFVGLVSETREELGGINIGPTLKCLLGNQFFSLKYGDRYFFDTVNEKFGFTEEQLAALRATRFSSVVCENTGIDRVSPDAFRLVTVRGNNALPCNRIRRDFGLSLDPFR